MAREAARDSEAMFFVLFCFCFCFSSPLTQQLIRVSQELTASVMFTGSILSDWLVLQLS